MRRINVYIDDELDDQAEEEARRRGTTKSALIRRGLRMELGTRLADPIDALVGFSDDGPVDDIDSVIYGA